MRRSTFLIVAALLMAMTLSLGASSQIPNGGSVHRVQYYNSSNCYYYYDYYGNLQYTCNYPSYGYNYSPYYNNYPYYSTPYYYPGFGLGFFFGNNFGHGHEDHGFHGGGMGGFHGGMGGGMHGGMGGFHGGMGGMHGGGGHR